MSLDELNKKLDKIDAKLNEEEVKKKEKKKLFKGWGKAKRSAKKSIKQGKILICYLKNNRDIDFFWAEQTMGLIDVDPNYQGIRVKPYHGFEPGAVYSFKNKWPVIVVPEWRLLPVGGVVEDTEKAILFGGDVDKVRAGELNILSMSEITLANMMEKKEIDASAKKKGNWGWLLWVGIGIVALYLIARVMGWIK